ncbi:MAG: hypothetical protein R6V72_06755, partial [Cyclobacterium sp.]
MKKNLLLLALLFLAPFLIHAQVGIGTENPHVSAALEIESNDKGLLIPRLTLGQRNGIQNPAESLLIYQIDGTAGFYFFNGNSWTLLKNPVQQNSDWEANSGETEILNKPDLSKVALSGNFSDLDNVPALVFASDTSKMLLPFLTLAKIQPFLDLKVDVSAFASEMAAAKAVAAANSINIALKEDAANKSEDVLLSDETNTKFPTELAVKTFVDASVAAGSEALSEEIDRATAAEMQLAEDLEAETIRATGAENTLTTNLSTEASRAMAAEDKLTADLFAETTRAIDAENTLTTDLAAETSRAKDAENTLATDLATETARAIDAEGVLQSNIETVQEDVDTNQTAAETAIALKEDAANKSEDVLLSDETNTKFPTELAVKTFVNATAAAGSEALSEEIDRATAAEMQLAEDLEAEMLRATDAENTLAADLDAETTRATGAENTLTDNLASEATRAMAAEAVFFHLVRGHHGERALGRNLLV